MVWCKKLLVPTLGKVQYIKLKTTFNDYAKLNLEPLRQYLEHKKAVQALVKKTTLSKIRGQQLLNFPLCPENLADFKNYQALLKLKGYSERTLETYANAFHNLLR